jgi:hypothetical protein
LGFLNCAFDIGLFTLFGLSIEFNLGFFCTWVIYLVWPFHFELFKLGFLSWAFHIFGLLVEFNLSFVCLWSFYCSLTFRIGLLKLGFYSIWAFGRIQFGLFIVVWRFEFRPFKLGFWSWAFTI